MALVSIIEGFKPLDNQRLIDKAEALKPVLIQKEHDVVNTFHPFKKIMMRYDEEEMKQGDMICLDFGSHYVGYLHLDLNYKGSHPDAPVYMKLKFCERMEEIYEDTSNYNGWISKSWIQEEYIHVDTLPAHITLPRRYAFRYVSITVIDTSPKYALTFDRISMTSVSSVDMDTINMKKYNNNLMNQLNTVSLRTLQNCMQDVFEDGPKRDQRLWMGDLRLQALTNYISFKNYDLVKRCLYLFAGSRFPDGRIAACVFTKPKVEADDTYLYDYSLFFIVALEEYLEETDDKEALEDLYEIAMEQIDLSLKLFEDGIATKAALQDFVDWSEGVDKVASAQAETIYCLKYALKLADRKKNEAKKKYIQDTLDLLMSKAKDMYDQEHHYFVSNGQVSIMSQVWMILARVIDQEEARIVLLNTPYINDYKMNTPYMHHYYVMALLECGLKEEAFKHMEEYWGGMLKLGADTFYEAFDPKDPHASPYGGSVVNSYCHAWSCTPAYLMAKYFDEQ